MMEFKGVLRSWAIHCSHFIVGFFKLLDYCDVTADNNKLLFIFTQLGFYLNISFRILGFEDSVYFTPMLILHVDT